ncbi:ergothioneine biosynthesis protein EgtB [Rhodoblastus acidophilus]|uniref:Ergothioneine biosynthesis protein EgtB n=1 Tax=Candidatus Rhodoblastus alkanivorans TaxID=2954117 RepID=A0ABS9ZBC7_9HYPH|nr:ergothioneine biosynthesis protein EgtB [Candidatus Rhodoblastus alkanivorans]MCI4684785.1 ergothioneine biosynthesis protein EgtB [Candidatus Rhodoblastus alkanivorans]MDI4642109.1 ergothioneine biosynthesis protein EgtB [Rhodoblastus acidophilus]
MSSGKTEILVQFQKARAASRRLAAPLTDADATVQSMPDASPAKWHLAHTTWFFEAMVLEPFSRSYRVFDPNFNFLFNSYYETLGARQPRPRRGMLTRPTLEQIHAYRDHVDAAIEDLLRRETSDRVAASIELGCHHEQQHQELLLTDILHLFAQNPLRPAYLDPAPDAGGAEPTAMAYENFAGGIAESGAGDEGFAFDCERPRRRVLIEPYRLADRLVTNGEWMEFIADDGYRQPLLWLSEGWAKCLDGQWSAPLYWEERDGEFWTMTLSGFQRVDPAAPAVHISFFEADAFARWSNRRLPTEAEWERAAEPLDVEGNFVESGLMRPSPATAGQNGLRQMFGDVWEWTCSPFSPYPRFRPAEGAAGEYNGKFMCGQFVLRGGSCATPQSHMRATYRNFFPPDARWQFSGVRLAGDADDDRR